MERVLIASASERGSVALTQFLNFFDHPEAVVTAASGAEARRLLLESEYELVIINTPLSDEFGHDLAISSVQDTTAGILLIANAEALDGVAEKVEPHGVLTVAKPLNRALVFQALRLLSASRKRLLALQAENRRLRRQMEDLRIINRAKCTLIELRGMTEPQAHSYIEKQAMDRRITKRAAAQGILQAQPDIPL